MSAREVKPLGARRLRAVRGLVATFAIVVPALMIAAPLVAWASGQPLRWVGSTQEQLGPVWGGSGATPAAVANYADRIIWSAPGASPGWWLLSLVPPVAGAALIAVGGRALWRLLCDVGAGEPFTGPALRRVELLSRCVFAYGLLVPLLELAVALFLTWGHQVETSFYYAIPPGYAVPVVVGLVLLVLVEVYRRGLALREDAEGLI